MQIKWVQRERSKAINLFRSYYYYQAREHKLLFSWNNNNHKEETEKKIIIYKMEIVMHEFQRLMDLNLKSSDDWGL